MDILPRMTEPSPGAAPAIRLAGVRKAFGEVHAVRGLDLDIADGEFFAMLGPSGSGKTTVLRMIAASSSPTPGRCCSAARTSPASPRSSVTLKEQGAPVVPAQ